MNAYFTSDVDKAVGESSYPSLPLMPSSLLANAVNPCCMGDENNEEDAAADGNNDFVIVACKKSEEGRQQVRIHCSGKMSNKLLDECSQRRPRSRRKQIRTMGPQNRRRSRKRIMYHDRTITIAIGSFGGGSNFFGYIV